MNNAKMWLVVKPAIGVPLFFVGVVVASFAVHVAVLSYAGWYDDYLGGRKLDSTASMTIEAPAPQALIG